MRCGSARRRSLETQSARRSSREVLFSADQPSLKLRHGRGGRKANRRSPCGADALFNCRYLPTIENDFLRVLYASAVRTFLEVSSSIKLAIRQAAGLTFVLHLSCPPHRPPVSGAIFHLDCRGKPLEGHAPSWPTRRRQSAPGHCDQFRWLQDREYWYSSILLFFGKEKHRGYVAENTQAI